MNLSGISVLIAIALLIGKIVKTIAQKNQTNQNREDGQNPSVPYRENQPQGTSAHEDAAKPKMWKGFDSFREMIESFDQEGTSAQGGQKSRFSDPSVNFAQAFENEPAAPIPPVPAPREEMTSPEGRVSTQGRMSAEGRVSTQGRMSAEGRVSTQGRMSPQGSMSVQGRRLVEGTFSREGKRTAPRRRNSGEDAVPVSPRVAHEYFANSAELRRAVIMSEVLAKPVSLRRKRAI